MDFLTFLQCFKHSLWGANNVFISKWEIGDRLIFKVGDKLIAVAEITGEAFMDDSIIWSNGLYWNRVPLNFIKVLTPNDGISFNDKFKSIFERLWGKKYGWVILNKHPLPDEIVTSIFEAFDAHKDLTKCYNNIDELISNVS